MRALNSDISFIHRTFAFVMAFINKELKRKSNLTGNIFVVILLTHLQGMYCCCSL